MDNHKGQTYYQVLGVSQTASGEEIRRAYRTLAKKYHPDANKETGDTEERFREIAEAYKILSDEEKRREYDQRRTPPPGREPQQYKYANTSYRYKPRKGFKYRQERFLSTIFRTAIYSLLVILILSAVLYIYKNDSIQLGDYFATSQEHKNQEFPQPELNEPIDTQLDQKDLGFTTEGLGKEIILELREKEEQKWREQWSDEDKYNSQRRFQEQRMEETYELRQEWGLEREPSGQDDDEAGYGGY